MTSLWPCAPRSRLRAHAVRAGDDLSVAGLSMRVMGESHAEVHPDIPTVPNVGYLLGADCTPGTR